MNYVFIFIIVILSIVYKCTSICTPVYGREPCPYSPALPGHVPNCARPGVTFCEHPSYYPGQVIQYLLEKWKFDHATLLMDESQDDFNSYYISSSDSKYSPNSIYGTPNSLQPDSYFPEPIHIPKPQYPTFYPNSNSYIPPHQQNFSGYQPFAGYPDRRPASPSFFEPYQPANHKSPKNAYIPPIPRYPPNVYKYFGQPQVQQYSPNAWWKRQAQDERAQSQLRRKRAATVKNLRKKLISIENSYNGTSPIHSRRKRQNALSGQQLCEITSQFIMPRAALNNKGDWKYVVNMPELDNRYTQLVKSESCASQVCNGICSLPTGYSSRCEQKYVQKRLIALETGGNELYTDVFWFPSCCQCTIAQN